MRRLGWGFDPGFSLTETLVALVVLSVGLLGMAALHVHALGISRSAQLRSHAVDLAADMAERIRATPQGQAAYDGAGTHHGCDRPGADCTPPQMAAHEVFAWNGLARRLLPNGAAEVRFDGGDTPSYTIRVLWDESGAGPTAHELRVQVGLR